VITEAEELRSIIEGNPRRGIVKRPKTGLPKAALQAFSDMDDAEEEGDRKVAAVFRSTKRAYETFLKDHTGTDWRVKSGEDLLSMTSSDGQAIDIYWDWDPMFDKVNITIEGPGKKRAVVKLMPLQKLTRGGGAPAAQELLLRTLGENVEQCLGAVLFEEVPWDLVAEDERFRFYGRPRMSKYPGLMGPKHEAAMKKGYIDMGLVNPTMTLSPRFASSGLGERLVQILLNKDVAFIRDPGGILAKNGITPQKIGQAIKSDLYDWANENSTNSAEAEDWKDSAAWGAAGKKAEGAAVSVTPVTGKTGAGYRITMRPTAKSIMGEGVTMTLADELNAIIEGKGREKLAHGKSTSTASEVGYAMKPKWATSEKTRKYAKKTFNKSVRKTKKAEIAAALRGEDIDGALQALIDEGVEDFAELLERGQVDVEKLLNMLVAEAQNTTSLGKSVESWANDAIATQKMDVRNLQSLARLVDKTAKNLKGGIARFISATAVNEDLDEARRLAPEADPDGRERANIAMDPKFKAYMKALTGKASPSYNDILKALLAQGLDRKTAGNYAMFAAEKFTEEKGTCPECGHEHGGDDCDECECAGAKAKTESLVDELRGLLRE